MRSLSLTLAFVIAVFCSLAQLPVVNSHPRLFLDAPAKALLAAKKANNNPDWIALEAEADNYAARQVMAWNPTNTGIWNTDYIFYNYCGSSWDDATFSLGMAHQLTKGSNTGSFNTKYSDKLLQLADTIIAGYAAYPPCSGCPNMFLWNSTYATRHVGNVVGIIYDWCYDELGPQRKAALIHIMEDFFNYMRVPYNVYQNNVHPTGNYYFGHVLCAAYFGYAAMYDSPMAQQMIDYARQRVLGTHSGTLSNSDLTKNWLKQSYTGPLPTSASGAYLGPAAYTVAPQKEGIPVQGWSYGGETLKRVVDYCYLVKTATGEKIADSLYGYFGKTSEAYVHALSPNRFQPDNSNDWGSFRGNLIAYSQPMELAAVLEGTPQGPAAEYTYRNWIRRPNLTNSWNDGYPELNWEKMLFRDAARPAAPFSYKPWYPDVTENTFNNVCINKTMPKYYMRENWSDTATWCALNLSNAFYDDHDHHDAGHFQIIRGDQHDGDDLLLVGASEVGNQGAFGKNGIEGGTCYFLSSSLANTLYIDDYNDYSEVNNNHYNLGGQSFWGYDELTHAEQNDLFSYMRSDLTSAYYRKGEIADTSNRAVRQFVRSFLYLRNSDIILSYDHITVKNSTHPNGQYKKHLRWHFLENPVVNGNNITAVADNSKLFVHTVIPAAVNILKVDESNNPDNLWGSSLNYAFNTYTYRTEVSVPGNPLNQNILTVFQPGGLTAPEMVTTNVNSNENNMEGTLVQLYGKGDLVLFNKDNSKYLVPVSAASYAFAGDTTTLHTLCGMIPGGTYQVGYDGAKVTVNSDPEGNVTASPAGLLNFRVPFKTSGTGINNLSTGQEFSVYPNPTSGMVNCNWNNASVNKVEIRNMLGQVIYSDKVTGSQASISLDLETSGVYVINLLDGKLVVASRKLVVNR
jgi:hypothetical protein